MIIKTKAFKEIADKILVATSIDKNAANLEIFAKGNTLRLNVTNKVYFVSVQFPLEQEEDFRAVVDASLFLNLISGLTTDTFELKIKDTIVVIKANKSSYKLAMIYENDSLLELPAIRIQNKTVEMPIKNDILQSILTVNSKEVLKVKNIDVNELQKTYYIDEEGAFNFTTGACLNSFTLEKPVKLLLTDDIVKLFKLFTEDVYFTMGMDELPNKTVQTKVTFETSNTYVAAVVGTYGIEKIQQVCSMVKAYINESYSHSIVLSVKELAAAISRLMLFTKNSSDKVNMTNIPVTITIDGDEFIIQDNLGNIETVTIENNSTTVEPYIMRINVFDLKLVLDSCKIEHITLNCGNHKTLSVSRGNINNIIPELEKKNEQ